MFVACIGNDPKETQRMTPRVSGTQRMTQRRLPNYATLLAWRIPTPYSNGCVDLGALQFPQMIRQENFRLLNQFQVKKDLQRTSPEMSLIWTPLVSPLSEEWTWMNWSHLREFPQKKPRLTANFGRTLRRSFLHTMLTLQTRASGTCNEPPENNSKVIYRRFCGVATTRDLSASYFSTIQHLTFETCTASTAFFGNLWDP